MKFEFLIEADFYVNFHSIIPMDLLTSDEILKTLTFFEENLKNNEIIRLKLEFEKFEY